MFGSCQACPQMFTTERRAECGPAAPSPVTGVLVESEGLIAFKRSALQRQLDTGGSPPEGSRWSRRLAGDHSSPRCVETGVRTSDFGKFNSAYREIPVMNRRSRSLFGARRIDPAKSPFTSI